MEKRADEFLTLTEAAKELRLSVSTLKRYIRDGHLRSYRTPGGGHRVRRAELQFVLSGPLSPAHDKEAEAPSESGVAADIAAGVAEVLEQRLIRLEQEVDRLQCSLEAIVAALRHAQSSQQTSAVGAHDARHIKVLGPGCRACNQLALLVNEVLAQLGLGARAVARVKDIEEIADYGPLPMPALVVGDQLLAAGRLPSKARLTQLLRQHLLN